MKNIIIILFLFPGLNINIFAQNNEYLKLQYPLLTNLGTINQLGKNEQSYSVKSYNSRFFGVIIIGSPNYVVKSFLNTPEVLTTFSQSPIILGGAFVNGVWYGNEVTIGVSKLVTIDTSTGLTHPIGNITGLLNGHIPRGLAWNETNKTMYLLSNDDILFSTGALYTINMATCALTLIGITIGSSQPMDIAFNNEGILYSIDIGGNVLNTINITTGAVTAVGSLGIDVKYNLGMCFDPSTDSLFVTALNTEENLGQLLRCNTLSGATTLVGNFNSGKFIVVDAFVIIPPTPVSVGNDLTQTPLDFQLSQNYPNPFNPTTKISFEIPRSSHINIVIYDIVGKEVVRLVNNELKQPGRYNIEFNGKNIASGVYFYRLETSEFTQTKRMVLIK